MFPRLLVSILAVLALGAAAHAPAASADTPSGAPNDTGADLPPYNCGGCSLPPIDHDYDDDGLSNYSERTGYVINGRRVFTNPELADSDYDRLSDYEEVTVRRPEVRNTGGDSRLRTHLDPTNRDTDGDRFSDGAEVNLLKSNANAWDSDLDGLGDHDERARYRTNLINPDTDRDCRKDGDEVRAGTNPRSYTREPSDACQDARRRRLAEMWGRIT